MDFSSISLSREETKILNESINKSIPVEKCQRLLRLKLVYEEKDGLPGYMPYGIGICRITDTGIDYLAYQHQHRKDMWLENGKIPIIVTIVTNLVISGIKWLLPLIQQWLSSSH